MKKLGDIIKQYREENTLSLREFAEKCDVSHTYIDKLEKGIDPRNGKPVMPTLDTVERISRALGITVKDLLEQIGYILSEDNTSISEIEGSSVEEKDLEQQIDEIMTQQGLMLHGEVLDDEDKEFLRNALKAGLKYAADVRKKEKEK